MDELKQDELKQDGVKQDEGSTDQSSSDQPAAESAPQPQAVPQGVPQGNGLTASQAEPRKENVLAGVVGALLFALVGGLLYFIIYQFGYIAGICGLITVILSSFGYGLFSGKKNSLQGVIIAVVMSIAAIFAAEYFGLAYMIFSEFKTVYAIDFFDAVRATPTFLAEPEVMVEFIKDLAIAYVLGAVSAFSTIRNAIASSRMEKANKEAREQQSQ